MALKLDENYNGSTLLSEWWVKVKNNFAAVKAALEQESADRAEKTGELEAELKTVSDQVNSNKEELNDIYARFACTESSELSDRIQSNADKIEDIDRALSGEYESVLGTQIAVISNKIGNLDSLPTTDKTSVVNAIVALKQQLESSTTGGDSIYAMSDYSVEYFEEGNNINAYAKGQPGDMHYGVYIYSPEREIDNIILEAADGESELAIYSGKLYPGKVYILRFDAVKSDMIAALNSSDPDMSEINEAIALINEDITVANEDIASLRTDVVSLQEKMDEGGKTAYEYAVEGGYVGTEEEFAKKLAEVGGEDKKNLFSFENAAANMAMFSKNSVATNYIYSQQATTGYKDTANKKFVFNGGTANYGITGGLELPLPAGSYKVSAEVYIPSGNTTRKNVRFGIFTAPSVYAQYNEFTLSAQDTWEQIEMVVTVAEGDTATYVLLMGYAEAYQIHCRNIKVVSLNPELTGWEGKKWVVMGDSITEKNSKTLKNYHDYIAEDTGINVVNMGVSGTGYKSYEDTNNAFYQRISNVPKDTDVVTIFGSGNDLSGNYTLGNATDTGTDTLCGCINKTIDNLYSILPTVQLGIITPNPWGSFNPSDDNNLMAQYSAKIVEICRLRGIPCLDLYHCSGLRPWDLAFLNAAYPMNTSGNARDTVHPNEVGHAIIAPRIKAFVQSLIM